MPVWIANIFLLTVVTIWASTFLVIQNAIDDVPPVTLIAIRFVLASILLVAMFHKRLLKLTREQIRGGIIVGLVLCLGIVLQTIGLQFTTVSRSGFITGLNVAIVPLLALIILRQRPPLNGVIGLGIAVFGFVLLTWDRSTFAQDEANILLGDMLTLGTAFMYALHIVVIDRFVHEDSDAISLSVIQIVVVAVVSTPAAFLFEQPTLALPPSAWRAIVYLSVVATALVLSLQVFAQQYTTSTQVALIFAVQPVIVAAFGIAFAGNRLQPLELIGCALILIGTLVGELKLRLAISGSTMLDSQPDHERLP